MRTHKIAAIGGDGIGPEVIAAGLEVLNACGSFNQRIKTYWREGQAN